MVKAGLRGKFIAKQTFIGKQERAPYNNSLNYCKKLTNETQSKEENKKA